MDLFKFSNNFFSQRTECFYTAFAVVWSYYILTEAATVNSFAESGFIRKVILFRITTPCTKQMICHKRIILKAQIHSTAENSNIIDLDIFTGDSITGILRCIEALLAALAIAAGYFVLAALTGGGV